MAGSKPDWWQTLDDGMTVKDTVRTPRRSIAINYPTVLYSAVLEAAALRRMSATGYQRRASLAFAHWDLGFNWAAAMSHEPYTYVSGPWRILDLAVDDA